MTEPEPLPPAENQPAAPPSPPASEPYPFWTWTDFVLLALAAFPLLVLALLIVRGFLAVTGWQPHARAAAPIAVQFLFYAFWFVIVFQLIRLRYSRPFWRSLAWTVPPGGFGKAALWGVATALGSVALTVMLRTPEIKTPMDELLQDPVSIALMVVFGVTLGPLCEELAFRGLLLPLITRSLGAAAGILLTAIPFAVLHGAEYAWNWQRILVIFFAGAMFGWVRWRTNSTAASTIMHSLYNLTFFVGFVAQKLATVH